MKKVLLTKVLLLMAVMFTGVTFAQTVTGTVSEANGPLPGASVIVKGTSNGASTDFDGNYTLNNVPSDATLVFSYVGFTNQEVKVNGRTTIDVTLESDNALDEVVLIGYGSTTVKDATGAVASVTSEDFNAGVIASPEQLIQGKTAGVQISESSGEPGAGIAIRIRGANSIRSGNDPLFVVDGVPLGGGGAPGGQGIGGQGAATSRNPLSFINPADIESISILKDASSTAIYGSRGANGVVIIQTKSGRGNSGGSFEINTSMSYSETASRYDLLNRDEFIEALPDFVPNVNLNDPSLVGSADTDFQDVIFREALSRRTDLSYSRSYTGGNVRGSVSYSNQNGVVENSGQERITARLNAQQRFFDDKLTIDFQGSVARVNDETAFLRGGAGSTGDLIGATLSRNPTFPADPDFDPGDNSLNPASLLRYYQDQSKTNRFLANLSTSYAITNDLTAKVTVGYDYSDSERVSAFSPGVVGLNGITGIGSGAYNTLENTTSLLDATLNYKKDFGDSQLDVVAGFSYQKFDRNGVFGSGLGFGSDDLDLIESQMINTFDNFVDGIEGGYQNFGYDDNLAFVNRFDPNAPEGTPIFTNEIVSTSFDRTIRAYTGGFFDNFDELQSYFIRANYSLNDKFLFTGTVRADGSSKFGTENQYGYFPSGAFAWKLHNEDFVGDNISTLKLRLGAGVVGNQEGLDFAQFLLREVLLGVGFDGDQTLNDNLLNTGFVGNNNGELKWESTLDLNLGVDFGINNDRLNGSFNVYRKETSDLLLRRDLSAPQVGGIPTIFSNLSDGKIINEGVELGLNYAFIETDDIGFDASFNIAYNRNEVTETAGFIDLGPIRGNGLTGASAQRLQAGQPLFSFYMAEFTGFDDDGNPTYVDVNGDGVGDSASDKKFLDKSALPKITTGLSLNFRYKNFDVSTFLNGQFGQYVFNATDLAFFGASSLSQGKNVVQSTLTNGESAGASTEVSSRYLEKGDFVRMQNATVAYNFPLKEEGLFDSLRISLTGQNLFLISGYSGLDPEISTDTGSLNSSSIPGAGIDYSAFPRARTFTLGLNAKF